MSKLGLVREMVVRRNINELLYISSIADITLFLGISYYDSSPLQLFCQIYYFFMRLRFI